MYNRFNRWSHRGFWLKLLDALVEAGAVTRSTTIAFKVAAVVLCRPAASTALDRQQHPDDLPLRIRQPDPLAQRRFQMAALSQPQIYGDPFNPATGQMEGDRLAAYLSQDVMPAVAASFRVSGDPAEIGVGGFSYGGIAVLHLALTHPQLFSKALIESPSLQVGNGQLLRDAADAATLPNRIYIGVGGEEAAPPPGAPPAVRERIARINAGLVEGARRLRNRLATALEAPTVKLVIDPAAHHGETAWAKRLPAALTFLFGLGDAKEQAQSK